MRCFSLTRSVPVLSWPYQKCSNLEAALAEFIWPPNTNIILGDVQCTKIKVKLTMAIVVNLLIKQSFDHMKKLQSILKEVQPISCYPISLATNLSSSWFFLFSMLLIQKIVLLVRLYPANCECPQYALDFKKGSR